MRVLNIVGLSFCILIMLSACQQQQALPTAMNLESAQTVAAVTQASLPTATPTLTPTRRAELPPTFTPTPSETPRATSTGSAVSDDAGRLYYLYNDDSIASVNANGTDNTIVVTLGVGQVISEYAISPDKTRIAFVAPGNGSAREVYISKIDGTDIQRYSCLGLADVRNLLWTANGTQMVFFAAPLSTSPGDLYLMQTTKQNTNPLGCVETSSIRVLAPIQASDFRGMAFNRDSSLLFYAGGGASIYVWDIATSNRFRASDEPPNGPDTAPRQNPVTDELVFLRQSIMTTSPSGTLARIADSSIPPVEPFGGVGDPYDALDLRWSADGNVLLIIGTDNIQFFDNEELRLVSLPIEGLRLPEAAALNNDSIAYTAFDSKNVMQIYVYDVIREETRQVTQNPDGTMRSITWLEPAL